MSLKSPELKKDLKMWNWILFEIFSIAMEADSRRRERQGKWVHDEGIGWTGALGVILTFLPIMGVIVVLFYGYALLIG